jgi:hypothetical protein
VWHGKGEAISESLVLEMTPNYFFSLSIKFENSNCVMYVSQNGYSGTSQLQMRSSKSLTEFEALDVCELTNVAL